MSIDPEPTAPRPAPQLAVPDTLLPLVRHVSRHLTPLLYRLPVTPNQITTASLILGVAGAGCFLAGRSGWSLAGALLLTVSYVLDNCDGEIARLKNLSSEFGARLDDVADSLVDTLFFAALGYGTYQASGERLWLWLGLAAAAGAAIDYVIDRISELRARGQRAGPTREEQARDPRRPETPLDWALYILQELARADFCLIVLALALFDATWFLLPFAAVGAQVYWATGLLERARGYHV